MRHRSLVCRSFLSTFALLALSLLMTACSDGGTGNATLVSLFVSGAQTIDAGQTTTVTASLTNDSTPGGATFTVSGGGTLSGSTTTTSGNVKKVSVNYTAPATATVATITATSVAAPAQSYPIVITVNPALVLTTTSLPVGSLGTAYDVSPSATGGTGTLVWSVKSGALPTGLTLNAATGEISGTPTAAGSSTFTLAVTDSAPTPMTAVQTLVITINPPVPVVTAATLPVAVVGAAYSQQLAYSGGGTGTAVWAIASGSLPAGSGLTLSSAGLISGTPTTANATYTFSVTVTVGTQTSAPVSLTIKTVAALVVTTTSLPSGHINVAYSQALAYSGGDPQLSATWAIVSGALPSTLTLSSAGVISGTPTVAASYTIGVAVTVGTQTSPTQSLTLNVLSTQITSAATASGEVGLPFVFQVTALGGTAPYTYSVATGSNPLPGGLSINASTGLITGTPTTNTGSPFGGVVVQAKDSLGATGTQTMTFTIAASRGNAANGEMNGQYAFLLTGFDAAGNAVDVVGSFTADGSGHVTAGVVDTNGTAMSATSSNVALSASTYAVGSDGRGQITLTTAAGSSTYVLSVSNLVGGVATAGAMTEWDATGRRLSGQIAKQTPAAFTVSTFNSGFAFGVFGFGVNNAAVRSATVGEVQFAGTSAVASSEFVSSSGSPTAPVVPTAGTLTVGANGRGTLSLVSASGTVNFTVYVVSASRMLLLSSDPGTSSALLAGDAVAQTVANGSFTAATLNGSAVFHEDKLVGAAADEQIGAYTFDGAGGITGLADRNAAGQVTQSQLAGDYTVAANGRVVAHVMVAALGGCLDCSRPSEVMYLAGNGRGYLIDFAVSGGSGAFEPQSTATSVSGAFALGTDAAVTTASLPESGLLTFSGASVTGLLDQAVSGALAPDTAFNGAVAVGTAGRTTVGSSAVVYLVSPTRGLWLDTTGSAPVVREINHQ